MRETRWQHTLILSAIAILSIPYALFVAYWLMQPFIWLFYVLLFVGSVAAGAAVYRRWRDGDWY